MIFKKRSIVDKGFGSDYLSEMYSAKEHLDAEGRRLRNGFLGLLVIFVSWVLTYAIIGMVCGNRLSTFSIEPVVTLGYVLIGAVWYKMYLD